MESFRDPQEVQLGTREGHQTKALGGSVQPGCQPQRCSGPVAGQEAVRGPRGACAQEMAQIKEGEIETGTHQIRIFSARCLKNKHYFAPSMSSQIALQRSNYPLRGTRQMGIRFLGDGGHLSTRIST